MSKRIRRTTVEVRRLLPTEAEVWVIVEVDGVTAATELRGRLMGPKCPGATTVEVAYSFRPPPQAIAPANGLAVRAIIPEPNLWTETTPYFYDGPLELWEDGRRCEVVQVSVMLRRLQG